MSKPWKITVDEVHTVMNRFADAGQYDGEVTWQHAEIFWAEYLSDGEHEEVTEAALSYEELDHQNTAALNEIAEIMIEEDVVQGPNPYEGELPE